MRTRYLALCLAVLFAESHANEKPQLPGKTLSTMDDMRAHDEALRTRFQKVKVGMTAQDVRTVMGAKPSVEREDLWTFRLSPASDTVTEKDISLFVRFKDGVVSQADVSYTCYYVLPHGL